jgi:hypothetical protein
MIVRVLLLALISSLTACTCDTEYKSHTADGGHNDAGLLDDGSCSD